MCTEEFSVTLDVIVSPKDRPNAAASSCPWQGYSNKGVSPKLLFMRKEELLAVTAEFGKCHIGVGTAGAAGALAPSMLKPRGRKYLFAPAIICQVYLLVDSQMSISLYDATDA